MRDAWRYNADCRLRIEAERLKYGAQIPVVRLSSDREIEEFILNPCVAGLPLLHRLVGVPTPLRGTAPKG
jgi:hypothetical protein